MQDVNGSPKSVRLVRGCPERRWSLAVGWVYRLRRYFLTGLLVLVPAWGTFLILSALVTTIDGWVLDVIGPAVKSDVPGVELTIGFGLMLLTGVFATHVLGQKLVRWADDLVQRIPLVRSIYLTLRSMADLFQFRDRFGRSTVVVFPFPRDGLWALGFVMGVAPPALQVAPVGRLLMVFVPTAIHPFTGYLAFVPEGRAHPVNLLPEDAIKMEFSAGLYRPRPQWLAPPAE